MLLIFLVTIFFNIESIFLVIKLVLIVSPLRYRDDVCVWQKLKSQLILLFNLFFLLFMGLIALFGTIHGFHYTILVNFYLYLLYFQQNFFNFIKISGSQTAWYVDIYCFHLEILWEGFLLSIKILKICFSILSFIEVMFFYL